MRKKKSVNAMPKTKSKNSKNSKKDNSFMQQISRGLKVPIMQDDSGKPLILTSSDYQFAQTLLQVASTALDANQLSKDIRAQVLCAFWNNAYSLFFDAYNKQLEGVDLSDLRKYKGLLDQRYPEMRLLVFQYILNPQNTDLSIKTKHVMYQMIEFYLNTLCQFQFLFGFACLKVPSLIQVSKECYARGNAHRQEQETLFKDAETLLGMYEVSHLAPCKRPDWLSSRRLSAQYGRASIMNTAMAAKIRDFLYVPVDPGTSHANSESPSLSLLKQDPFLRKHCKAYETYAQSHPHTTANVVTANPSAAVEEDSLILDVNLEPDAIDRELQKIMACLNNPHFNQKALDTSLVRQWLAHAERLPRIQDNINAFLQKLYAKYRQYQPESAIPVEAYQIVMEKHALSAKVMLYFFRHLHACPELTNHTITATFFLQLIRLQIPLLNLLTTKASCYLPPGQYQWFATAREKYWSVHESLYPYWVRFFLRLASKEQIPGFYTKEYPDNQAILDKFTPVMVQIQLFRCMNFVYEDKLDTAKTALRNALFLMKSATGQMGAPSHEARLQTTLDASLTQHIRDLETLLANPLTDSIRFEQQLRQMEPAFDQRLISDNLAIGTEDGVSVDVMSRLLALLQTLQERSNTHGDPDGYVSLLTEQLLPVLPECFGQDPRQNLLHAQTLLSLFSLCLKNKSEHFHQLMLHETLTLFHASIQKALPRFEQQITEMEQTHIKHFLQLLEQDSRKGTPIEMAESLQYANAQAIRHGFLYVLNKKLKRTGVSKEIYALGVLARITANTPETLFFHENIILRLYKRMSKGLLQYEYREAQYAYQLWQSHEHAWIVWLKTKVDKEIARSHWLPEVLKIRLDAVALSFWHEETEAALAKMTSFFDTFDAIAEDCSPEQRESILRKAQLLQQQINNPWSLPKWMAFMRCPCPSEAPLDQAFPPEPEHCDFDKDHYLRLQHAWQQLIWKEESPFDAQQAKKLFEAWLIHFQKLPCAFVARQFLQKQWIRHYREYKNHLSNQNHEPKSSERELPKQASFPSKIKTDWEALKQANKLNELEQHNFRRGQQLAALKARRKLQRMAAQSMNSVPLDMDPQPFPDEEAIILTDTSEPMEPEFVAVLDSESLTDALLKEPAFPEQPLTSNPPPRIYASWVDAVVGKAFKPQDFPSLPSAQCSQETPIVSEREDNTKEAEDEPQLTLPADYHLPPRVQAYLKALTDAGHLARLGGGGVRNIFLNIPANDYDIFTDCPPEMMLNMLPDVKQSDNFPELFFGKGNPDELSIDIKCMHGHSSLDFALEFDYTVNCLFITPSGELEVPLKRACTDLINHSLQSIIELDASFEMDITRLWRMIRLANHLEWSLDSRATETIKAFAPKICQMNIHQFLAHFKKCFVTGDSKAIKNLDSFHSLDLLPWLLSTDGKPCILNQDALVLCRDTLGKLCHPNSNKMLVDALALFAIIRKTNSFSECRVQTQRWLNSLGTRPHNPRVLEILNRELPKRLRYYYNKCLFKQFDPEATPFNPYSEGNRFRFWQTATEMSQKFIRPGSLSRGGTGGGLPPHVACEHDEIPAVTVP
jgi:hypothetical protein